MKPREALSRLNRLQRTMPFKIIASIVLVGLAIAAFSAYYVVVAAPASEAAAREAAAQATEPAQPPAQATPQKPGEKAAGAPVVSAEERSAIDAAQRVYRELLQARTSPANVGLGVAVVTSISLVVTWLGLGLTYLALLAVAVGVVFPLRLLGMRGLSELLMGIVALTAAFTALMQGMRVVYGGSGPVLAVARNALAEAVRMKISLVFIVILIFALAALPQTLSMDTPLRYRVQAFLQYGTGGSYWVIAILTLFFAAASVAFEQRDKQIWQTMTKPVSSVQYILGKWLGVVGLSAVLLAVCCAGVFLFTEYLRKQPAQGESAHLVSKEQSQLTEDRFLLETQVLAARKSAEPIIPVRERDEAFLKAVGDFIEQNRVRDPEFAKDQETYDKVVSDLYKSSLLKFRSIDPGDYRVYKFEGLQEARQNGGTMSVRFRVDAGSNAPDQLYKISFMIGGVILPPREVTLGPTHSFPLSSGFVGEDGTLEMEVFNAALYPNEQGEPVMAPNAGTISFPNNGLELTYSAGSYRANFLRVAFVLWVKLAFLAMLAITAATFLSFPVACLVAFAIFLIAESTGFLSQSLEAFDPLAADQKHWIWWRVPVRGIGLASTWMFKTYADLKPTSKLVDGRLLSWSSVAYGMVVLAAWSGALLGLAVLIFRRRELATYSGQ